MEISPSNRNSHDWLAQAKPHTYDWNRSEDALLSTFGASSSSPREWNEEFQSCRELPRSTPGERIMRDRTMFRVYTDFADAATKGAVAVVHGHIPPVNPMDAPRSYVFIYNNIFFSFAVDAKDLEGEQAASSAAPGGPDVKVSYQMANNDLHGVRAYTELDLAELHTLATVLVDYRGHRVICQSIIPGIFHGNESNTRNSRVRSASR
jgi:protein TIF31